MATSELLLQLLIGGLLGLVGQTLRFLVGYKKLRDQASEEKKDPKELFETSTMLISLLIGFCAGILAIVSLSTFKADFFSTNLKQTILTIMAAGYAGTDFIEGFIKKYLPGDASAGEADISSEDGPNAPKPGAGQQPVSA